MLVLTIPMFRFLEIKTIGRLFVTDVIIMIIFPLLLLANHRRLSHQMPRMVLILGLIWLFGQITTDLIHHTPFLDYSRGWAKISVTLVNFWTLFLLLYGNRRRIVLFGLGLTLGGLLEFYFNPGIYAEGNPWKFGIGPSITWSVVLIASFFSEKSYLISIGIIMFASLLNLYMGFRSLAGICFLATAYLYLQFLCNQKYTLNIKLSTKNLAMIVFAVFIAGFLFIKGYEHLAGQGFLGATEKEKYERQALGDFGILLGGRSEILVSCRAIMDSPIIGHGSWAKDYKYADALAYLKRTLGYFPSVSKELDLIPTHSHLFGAWVEAGILGALFWAWMLTLPIRVLAGLYKTKEPLTPLIGFIAFTLIWDIFFSPFGAGRRFITPYYIIVMISFLPVKLKNRYFRKIRW